MFFNVLYMGLPTTFHDIEFVAPAVKEVERLREGIGSIPEKRTVFMLKCGEHRHIILAGAVKVCTSDMDPFESPFELPPVVTS